jgi:prepilin-type N-terminal cleavage/methylation domain-containing protein
MKGNKQQFGFSLIELMIGMVIGLLVTGIVITVFSQSKKSYSQDEEIAQLQENGRYALQLLTRELAMAGYAGPIYIVGDISTSVTGNPCGFADWYKIIEEPIIFPSTAPTCISGVKADTDILVIKRVAGVATATQSANKLYLRTSGTGGSIQQSIAGSSANPPFTDWEYIVRIYYIKDKTVDGETIPTLRRAQLKSDMTWRDEELVMGIENIQISFGIDSDSNSAVDTYKTSPSAAELKQAATAKVDILVRSINKDYSYTNEKTYYAGSTPITNTLNGSNYYGRVFSSTAPMRNISYRNNL